MSKLIEDAQKQIEAFKAERRAARRGVMTTRQLRYLVSLVWSHNDHDPSPPSKRGTHGGVMLNDWKHLSDDELWRKYGRFATDPSKVALLHGS
tara:strand:+ start:1409 stop:1687 length:279 start_codon:yes stop_codon:yes gene_type:complete